VPLRSVSRGFKDITNDILSLRNEDAIKRSVINLVRTRVGERFFNPLLGSKVENYFFELADIGIEEPLKEEIKTVINNFEPRVRLRNVDVALFPEDNAMDVSIVYDIVGLSVPQQAITFVLQPTRY
jgi:phage baseplate assembly protein W